MEKFIDIIANFLKMGIDAIFNFIKFVWTWSFGKIITIFQSDWQSLPIWKIVVLAVVAVAIVYVLYKVVMQIWAGVVQVLNAFVSLLRDFVNVLPHVLVAGLIAAAGGYVIQNINI